MKPEAQDSGTDAGRSERARGAVLMLIGFSVGFAVCYLLMTPAKNSPSTLASPSAVSARMHSAPFLPLARRPEADTRLMSYEYRDEDLRRALEELNTSIFGMGGIMQYLLVTPMTDSPSTVASPSAVSARVFTSPFLPLARRQEDGTYLMTYEYMDEDFRRALEDLNTSIFGMGGIIRSRGVFLQSQRVFYMEERLTMLDCAPLPWDLQQPRSLHLLDQRPAREFMSVTQ